MSPSVKASCARAAQMTTKAVFELKATDDTMSGTVAAELVAMSALEVLAALGGREKAAQVAYRLADGLATGGDA
jgi:hypothetical protein